MHAIWIGNMQQDTEATYQRHKRQLKEGLDLYNNLTHFGAGNAHWESLAFKFMLNAKLHSELQMLAKSYEYFLTIIQVPTMINERAMTTRKRNGWNVVKTASAKHAKPGNNLYATFAWQSLLSYQSRLMLLPHIIQNGSFFTCESILSSLISLRKGLMMLQRFWLAGAKRHKSRGLGGFIYIALVCSQDWVKRFLSCLKTSRIA